MDCGLVVETARGGRSGVKDPNSNLEGMTKAVQKVWEPPNICRYLDSDYSSK